MRKIKRIIIHCSASDWGNVEAIRDWHVNGNGWSDIGYNAIITNGILKHGDEYDHEADGRLFEGRGLDLDCVIDSSESGAHTRGLNNESIGICMIGDKKFTLKQFTTLYHFCKMWQAIVPGIEIKGHYHFSTKTCPNFNVEMFDHLLSHNTLPNEINMAEFLK